MGFTHSMAQWILKADYHDFSKDVKLSAKRCIIDTIGVALAGSMSEVSGIIREYVLHEPVVGKSLIWSSGIRTSPGLAALANGAMAHALDFDETNYSSIAHPSAVVLPAVLAVAEAIGCTGKEILSSFIVGYEVTSKLGAAVNPKAYEKGWWTTSALGIIGATAAVGRLLELNQQQTECALGLAIGQVSGVRVNNGTLTKPFMAGRAAQNGILSAWLAQRGMTASRAAFEETAGFFDVCVGGCYTNITGALGYPFDLVEPGVAFKQYPSCSASHAAVDALLEMISEYDLSWKDIASVTCEVTPLVNISLVYDSPTTANEARFSMPFCIAAALKEKQLLPSCFTKDYLEDSTIRDLMKKVTMRLAPVVSDAASDFSLHGPEAARVIIETKENRRFLKTIQHARGGTENPLSWDELVDKFKRCVEPFFTSRKISRIEDAVLGIETLKHVSELVKLLEIINVERK